MRNRKTKATRKLEETSWLAQSIADMMSVEFDKNGVSGRYSSLAIFKIIVNETDNKNNPYGIHYRRDERTCSLLIIIPDIPSLVIKHGTDFDRDGMRGALMGLEARYQDAVSAKTTHDMNSAVINVTHLMDSIRSS